MLLLLGAIYFGHSQLLSLRGWFVLVEILDLCPRQEGTYHANLGEYTPSKFWGLTLALA